MQSRPCLPLQVATTSRPGFSHDANAEISLPSLCRQTSAGWNKAASPGKEGGGYDIRRDRRQWSRSRSPSAPARSKSPGRARSYSRSRSRTFDSASRSRSRSYSR